MPNKQAQKQPKPHISARVNPALYTEYLKYGEFHGIQKPTRILEHLLKTFFSEHPTSKPLEQTKESIPEEIEAIFQQCKKKGCPAYPHFDSEAKEGICVFALEGKEPKIYRRSIIELKACSDTPILVSMARKKEIEEEFQYRIETLNAQIERAEEEHVYQIALVQKLKEKDEEHNHDVTEINRLAHIVDVKEKEIERLRRKLEPMQDLLTERDRLKSEVKGLKNGILERDEKIAILQTDNGYKDAVIKDLCEKISKLSESELLKENDDLHLQLTQKEKVIRDYANEIEKLEALNETQQRKTTEVISETRKMLRDFKQYLPTTLEPYDISTYIKNVQKRMEQFEGYLNTIAL
jgi:hypothetical protein